MSNNGVIFYHFELASIFFATHVQPRSKKQHNPDTKTAT
jgi:hypothetical protein